MNDNLSARKSKRKLNNSQIIALGFAGVIFVGALLLCLPIATVPGQETSFIDALFTATTSVCVTGLVTTVTASHWTLFGQIIILLLIQLGGIGVIAMTTMIFVSLGKRVSMRNRKLIQESYNLDSMAGLVRIVKKVLFCIIMAELIGMVFYAIRLVPRYGLVQGLWQSLFTSVSAFCNAGIDIMGENSLAPYAGDWLVNFTTMGLIVAGGLGFMVWWDLAKNGKAVARKQLPLSRFWGNLKLHSKVVLSATAVLILFGAFLIFVFEYHNPETLGAQPMGTRILESLFQSVTTRTAGFFTVDQAKLTDASVSMSLVWMFVGGSPMGTAGGIKTTTMVILIFTVIAYLKGKKDTELFHRRVKVSIVRSALVVVCVEFATLFVACILLSVLEPKADFVDIVYELTSAVATVGLSRGITPTLSAAGKLVVILTMYLGRIGPVTMATAIVLKAESRTEGIRLPEDNVMIG
ncbi:MAG: TrkH family potassium uptake protein [Blautia sp.]|jgi:trk system potassium uptake protein TrkH